MFHCLAQAGAATYLLSAERGAVWFAVWGVVAWCCTGAPQYSDLGRRGLRRAARRRWSTVVPWLVARWPRAERCARPGPASLVIEWTLCGARGMKAFR